jgi:hypothetical protein
MQQIEADIHQYIESYLFDSNGIMYGQVDGFTNQPLSEQLVSPDCVPRRASFNPVDYWAYEDAVMNMGLYMDGLVLKHKATGEQQCLDRATELWTIVEKIFSCSQIYGIGSFLRPYGGFKEMGRFAEPLGTDQASPLFSGLYRYMPYAPQSVRNTIEKVLLKTLGWYEQQDFSYFYYKNMIHRWEPPLDHAASYYLPAIVWASTISNDLRWSDHARRRLATLDTPRQNLTRAFRWGSELPILYELLDNRASQYLSTSVLQKTLSMTCQQLNTYSAPNMTRYIYEEAQSKDFKPYMKSIPESDDRLAHPFYFCVHAGRVRPRHELHTLCGLAAVGNGDARRQANELMELWQNVPHDFTIVLAEDYPDMPRQVHLYARAVGPRLVEWFRNYWLLKKSEQM